MIRTTTTITLVNNNFIYHFSAKKIVTRPEPLPFPIQNNLYYADVFKYSKRISSIFDLVAHSIFFLT